MARDWSQYERNSENAQKRDWSQYERRAKPEGIQYGKIAEDILSSPIEAVKAIGGMVKNLPSQLSDLSKYLESESDLRSKTGFNIPFTHKEGSPGVGEKIKHIGKVAGQGLLEGGKALINADKYANEYLKSVGLPEFIPEFGKELRQIGESENGKQLLSWANKQLESGDDRPMNDLIKGLTKFVPASALGAPATAAFGLTAAGENENPLAAMLIPGTIKAGAKGVTMAAPAITKAGKSIANTASELRKQGKGAIEALYAPERLEKIINETKLNKLAAEESLMTANEKAAAKHKEFTGTSASTAKAELAESLKKVASDISENLSKRYEEFSESPAGKRTISEPIDTKQLSKQYELPTQALSKETLGMLKREPTVNNYIDTWRQVRDEASHARKLSRGDISFGKKQAYVENAKSLEKLADDLNNKARKSLSSEETANFDALQKDYKNLKIPMRKSTIKKAIAEHPEISTKNFNASMSKIGVPELKDILLKDSNFREKLAKHDLMDLDVTNTKKLQQVLEGDTGKALPEKQFKELNEHLKDAQEQQKAIEQAKIDLAKYGLEKSEIDAKINKYIKLAKGGIVLLAGKKLIQFLLEL